MTQRLMRGKRNYRIDNMRALLILLVVLGHLTEITHYRNSDFVYCLIYVFHMPGFALLSGICWSVLKREQIWKKLVYPYVIFQTIYVIFQRIVLSESVTLQYTTPYWLMWYLLALIQWEMIASTIAFTPQNASRIVVCSLIVSMLSGLDDGIGYFLSLSRMLVLFPFFIIGVWLREYSEYLEKKSTKWGIGLAFVVLIICVILVWRFHKSINNIWLYNSVSYYSAGYHMGIRLGILILAAIMISCLLILIPNYSIGGGVSYLGQNTMPVYLLHGLIVRWLGRYSILWNEICCNGFILFVMAILIVAILASPPVIMIIKPLMIWPLPNNRIEK